MTEKEALECAIELADGQTELARRVTLIGRQRGLLGDDQQILQQHVYNWLNRQERCPVKFAQLVSDAVDGLVTREQLRHVFLTVHAKPSAA